MQVLLSGVSAVPPLFLKIIWDPNLSPFPTLIPHPLRLLPNQATFKHIELFLRWKLNGERDNGIRVLQGPPSHQDFTRGAELARIPWVRLALYQSVLSDAFDGWAGS